MITGIVKHTAWAVVTDNKHWFGIEKNVGAPKIISEERPGLCTTNDLDVIA